MRNFDTDRHARRPSEDERTFQLAGQVFVLRPGIRPEVLVAYDSLGEDASALDALKVMDDLMLSLIENRDEAHDRYRALRLQEDDPIELPDLEAMVKWVIESYVGRPTGQPSGSASGQNGTGTSSTVASPSPVTQTAPTI